MTTKKELVYENTRCEAPGCDGLVVKETPGEWYWFSCKIAGKEYKVCSRRCALRLKDAHIRKEFN